MPRRRCACSIIGLDFAFNLGQQKAWQIYVEPSLNYALNGDGYQGVQYNIDRSAFRLITKGMGTTDKLFEQVEFNRVATFNDVTKD